MSLVRTILDFAHNPLPVLMKRIVALYRRLQFEALGGVSNLLAPQRVNAPVNVLVNDRRRDLLNSHEVLLIE